MGRMHRLSTIYETSDILVKRDSWSRRNINNPHLQRGRFYVLLEKLISMESIIDSLPRSSDSFGLIHHDFHPYNFFIDNSEITVFDFDDSIYGWFSLDIAIAATHAVWWGVHAEDRVTKNRFAQQFLREFLMGYEKEHHISEFWKQTIPMFMEYRNICSFFWWLGEWDGHESSLTEDQQNAINHAVKLIERGLPFDGCDIHLQYRLIQDTRPRSFTIDQPVHVFGMHATSTNKIHTADFSTESLTKTEWALVFTLNLDEDME